MRSNKPLPASKSTAKPAATEEVVKKKPGRPPKAASAEAGAPPKTGAKRGRKPKSATEAKPTDDLDLSDIEDDLAGEPVPETAEKVKPCA